MLLVALHGLGFPFFVEGLLVPLPRGSARSTYLFSLLESPPSEAFDLRDTEGLVDVIEGRKATRGALVLLSLLPSTRSDAA